MARSRKSGPVYQLKIVLAEIQPLIWRRVQVRDCSLTKLHEEIWRGSVNAAREHFERNRPRGEFTLVVAGLKSPGTESTQWTEDRLRLEIASGLGGDEKPSVLARRLSTESGWERRIVYQMAQEIAEND